jgi:ABC-type phosphate transport system ATPase subunit
MTIVLYLVIGVIMQKTDEFNESEFKNIAYGINIVWNERLKQMGLTSKIAFPVEMKKQ